MLQLLRKLQCIEQVIAVSKIETDTRPKKSSQWMKSIFLLAKWKKKSRFPMRSGGDFYVPGKKNIREETKTYSAHVTKQIQCILETGLGKKIYTTYIF